MWTRHHPPPTTPRRRRPWLLGAGLLVTLLLACVAALWVNSALRIMAIRMTPASSLPSTPHAPAERPPQQVLELGRNMFQRQSHQPELTIGLSPSPTLDASPDTLDPPLNPPSGPQRSDLPVTLSGTMVASDPALSIAFMTDHLTKSEQTLRAGHHIYDAVVLRVERTRLWVRRAKGLGRVEFLALGEAGGASYIPPSPPAPPSAPTPSQITLSQGARTEVMTLPEALRVNPASMIHRDAHGNYNLDLQMVQQHADAALLMAESMNLELQTDPSGQVSGIRIGQVVPGSLFEHLGLRSQDVIVSVNGQPPNDERAAISFLEALSQHGAASVEVDRRGRRIPLHLSTSQPSE